MYEDKKLIKFINEMLIKSSQHCVFEFCLKTNQLARLHEVDKEKEGLITKSHVPKVGGGGRGY